MTPEKNPKVEPAKPDRKKAWLIGSVVVNTGRLILAVVRWLCTD
jgi:hypothetical protein